MARTIETAAHIDLATFGDKFAAIRVVEGLSSFQTTPFYRVRVFHVEGGIGYPSRAGR